MKVKDNLKQKVLEEIDQLPEDAVNSVYHILHYLRLELSKNRIKPRQSFSNRFLKTFGSWEDSRSFNDIVSDIHDSRCFVKKDVQW